MGHIKHDSDGKGGGGGAARAPLHSGRAGLSSCLWVHPGLERETQDRNPGIAWVTHDSPSGNVHHTGCLTSLLGKWEPEGPGDFG